MEITVIIPVYNREKLLPRTLASVVAQTYRPLHVVLVDNGSTDRSLAVLQEFCDKYAAPDFRVTVCEELNPGAPSARNAGLRRATSEWVMFFDSDDEMGARLVENYVSAIGKNPDADIVYTDMKIVDDAGRSMIKRSPRKGGIHFLCGNIFHTYFSTQRYVVRRDVIETVGAWNTEAFGWDDWELGIRLMLYTSRIVKAESSEPQVIVHAHADSITGTQCSDKVDKLLACVDEAEKHVRASGRRDADILLNCLDYKKIVLASACRREGSMRGEQLFHDVLRSTPSRKVKAVFVSGYWLASRGVRGTARVAERLFRLF